MNLKIGQPLPAKFVVLLGDILIALMSVAAMGLSRVSDRGTHTVLRSGMDLFPVNLGGVLHLPVLPMAAFTLMFVCMFYVFDLYDLRLFGESAALLPRLLWAGGMVLAALSAGSVLTSEHWHRPAMVQGVVTVITAAYAWRRFFARSNTLLLKQVPTAIIGYGPQAERIRSLMRLPDSRYRFTGFVHSGDSAVAEGVPQPAGVLGSISELDLLVERHGIRHLVLATDSFPTSSEPVFSSLKFQGVGCRGSAEIAMELTQSLPIELLNQSWLRLAEQSDLIRRHFTRTIKRFSDIVLSLIALVLYGPLMLFCGILVKLESPGPAIFRQTRVGWHGKPFTIFKLRSMRNESEPSPQWAQVADARVTRVGRILRRTHIDELPQLVNVLRGEMSFVGPRPERPEFVGQLNQQIPYYDVRHYIKPGITGWAQVNFRYGASVADARRKLEFDLYYVMHTSLLLDLLIILKTIQVVVSMRGSR